MDIKHKQAAFIYWQDLRQAYEEKYGEKLDLDDLFYDYVNDCFQQFDVDDTLYTAEVDESYMNYASYKVAKLLVDSGVRRDEEVYIEVSW